MTKVLLIADTDPYRFQKSINSAIEGKKVVDIKYQSILCTREYTNGVPTRSDFVDRALIIYEE